MPSLSTVRAANAAFKPDYKPVAIFVGGTSGIGQGICEAFTDHLHGKADIIIIGRNRDAAETILSKLPKPAEGDYRREFVQCDASRMKNVEVVTRDLLERLPKLNFLFLTAGYLSIDGKNETEEGLDRKMAVHYYSRWKFIHDLLPLLKGAKKAGEEARVLSMLTAGKGGPVDLNDIGLKKNFTAYRSRMETATYNDLMCDEFAHQNPDITFAHSYPGLVRTPIANASNSYLMWIFFYLAVVVAYPISTSIRQCGEYMLYGTLYSGPGFHRFGSRGETLDKATYHGSEEARKKVWEHSEEATKVSP